MSAKVVVLMEWPDAITDIFQLIQGAGGIVDVDEKGIIFDISGDKGLFELGQSFVELKNEISCSWRTYPHQAFNFSIIEQEEY